MLVCVKKTEGTRTFDEIGNRVEKEPRRRAR